jgi:hypothetical protein
VPASVQGLQCVVSAIDREQQVSPRVPHSHSDMALSAAANHCSKTAGADVSTPGRLFVAPMLVLHARVALHASRNSCSSVYRNFAATYRGRSSRVLSSFAHVPRNLRVAKYFLVVCA